MVARCYRIGDRQPAAADGELLARARASWVSVELESGRLSYEPISGLMPAGPIEPGYKPAPYCLAACDDAENSRHS